MPALLATLSIVSVLAMARAIVVAGLHVSFDPNEGWNAYHAKAAMAGGPLYPSVSHFMVNNYPPLSFYLVGALGRLTGDNIIAGRIVSLLSFAAVEALVVMAAIRFGCRRNAAMFGAVLLALYLLLGTDYVGMNDPQLLGHALELSGLVILLRDPANRMRIITAAALFATACFTKHNLIALPLALTIWLIGTRHMRSAIEFAAVGGFLALLGLAEFRLAEGTSLLDHLDSARQWSFSNIATALPAWLAWAAAPALALAAGLANWRDDPLLRFAALYAVLAGAIGLALLGGAGVDANALFDADIALCLGAARAIERSSERDARLLPLLSLLLVLPFAIAIASTASKDWLDPSYWLLSDDAETARNDVAQIEARPGKAFCETLALCYWAGKDAEVDVFNIGEALATGARSDAPLRQLIERRTYSTIEFESFAPFPLTPAIRHALDRNYRLEHQDDEGYYFVPRG